MHTHAQEFSLGLVGVSVDIKSILCNVNLTSSWKQNVGGNNCLVHCKADCLMCREEEWALFELLCADSQLQPVVGSHIDI